MQVHVKTSHTKIDVEGKVSKRLIKVLQEDYGKDKVVIEDDTLINVKESEWYKEAKARMTAKEYMKLYRETRDYTQAQLGEMLGNLTRQKVSDMERGTRPINKEIAKKLSKIFKISVEKFL